MELSQNCTRRAALRAGVGVLAAGLAGCGGDSGGVPSLQRADPADTEPRWSRDWPTSGGLGPLLTPDRVLAGKTGLQGSGTPRVVGYDVVTGEERWAYEPGRPVEWPAAVADGSVYLPLLSWDEQVAELQAIEVGASSPRWSVSIPPDSGSPSPVPGTDLVLVPADGADGERTRAVDRTDGRTRWDVDGSLRGEIVGDVFVDRVDETTIRGVSLADGSPAWTSDFGDDTRRVTHPREGPDGTALVVRHAPADGSDRFDREVVLVDPASGAATWRSVVGSVEDPSRGSRVAYDEQYVYTVVDGTGPTVTVGAVDRADGSVAWTHEISGRINRVATLGDTVLAHSANAGTVALSRNDGAPAWSFDPGGRGVLSTLEVVGDSRAYLTDHDGYVHAVDHADQEVAWTFRTRAGSPRTEMSYHPDGVVVRGGYDLYFLEH